MGETSWPLPATGRAVDDIQFEQLMATLTGDGLYGYPTSTTPVYADATGMHVKVRPNVAGAVRGHGWRTDENGLTLSIGANSGATRVDLVVLRLDRSDWSATMKVRAGSPGGAAPTPVQQPDSEAAGDGIWEIPIAEVRVGSGVSTILPSDVKPVARYAGRPPVVVPYGSLPPPQPALIAIEVNPDTPTAQRVSVSDGTRWLTIGEDVGPANVALGTNWEGIINRVYRRNGFAALTLTFSRPTINLPAGSSVQVGVIPAGYRPTQQTWTVGVVQGGGTCDVTIHTNGVIHGNFATGVAYGKHVMLAAITYPTNG